MKSNTPLLKTLLVAAAALSFCATPAWADDVTLGSADDGTNYHVESFTESSTVTLPTANYTLLEETTEGWLFVKSSTNGNNALGSIKTISFAEGTTFSGEGLFGIVYRQGQSAQAPTTIDLTNVDASGLTGQFTVVDNYSQPAIIRISGTTWSNVEYVFGDTESQDSTNNPANYTLTFAGATTLAGISGATSSSAYGSTSQEAITVETAGTAITLAGTGTYEYDGTLATSETRASLVMNSTGSGKQTFGGTNYLADVTVTSGTLALGGTTDISGTASVGADGTLDLSGTITLGSAISNSGSIVIEDDTCFVLDNLEGGHVSGTLIGYYELVEGNGGSISYNEGSISFSFNGSILDGWSLGVYNGSLYAYGEAGSFTWGGTADSHDWNTDASNETWFVGDEGDRSSFVSGSDVTFGTIGDESYGTVNVTTNITAGTIAVNDDYTFVFTDGIKVEAQYVDVATDKTLKLELASGASSAEFHMDGESFVDFFGGSENHGTVEIDSGVTFYLSDLGDSYDFNSNNTATSITGTGVLSIGATGGIGLYLPDFQGTVEFRSGTVRFGYHNDYEIGVYNSNATLQFDSGVGIALEGDTSSAVTAKLVFAEGSHTINAGEYTAEFSGAISGADATITINGTGNLTFSGGGTIGTLQLGSAATIVLTGNTTYTITEIAATAHANSKLEISEGTTVNAESLAANWHFETMQVDGVLNISGTAVFGTASVDAYVEHFTGSGIVTIGTLQIGHSSNTNGASIKIEGGITFIVGEVTSGGGTNHYVEIADATIGTNSDTLTFGADENKFVLSAEEGSATIFNTNKFDTETNTFSNTEGTTITIAANITGDGAMEVTGNGRLVLSGTSSLSSVTVNSGATLEIGGTIALSSAISNSGTIVIDDGTTFALDNLGDGYHLDGIGYYEIIDNTSGGTVSFTEGGNYIFTNGDTTLTGWTIVQGSDGNIWIYGIVGEFTWAGTVEDHNWSLQTSDQTWLIGGTDTGSFVNGSDATFGPITDGSPYATVNITESLTAGSITVQDNYTFVLSNGVTLEATYIDVLSKEGEDEGNYKLTLSTVEGGSATVLMDSENFYQFFTGDENQGDIEIGEGVTFYLSTLENNSASVTSASFSITGTGTLSVGATYDSGTHGQIGLYLPDFEGTVVFREGTTYARFGLDNGSYTGVYNANATLVFEAGVGMSMLSDLTVINGDEGDEDHRILASIEFEEGSHEIATNGHTAEFAGTVSGEKADITVSGAGTLTFSGESVSLGSLTFSGTSGNAAVTIKIGDGTTFTVAGNVIDATSSEMANISLGDGSTMIVGGMLEFSPGVAGSYDSTISGAGADKSTVVIGELVVGNKDSGTGGSAIEVSNVTLVVGALSFGGGTNSRFDLYLKDSTLGFSKDVTIEQSTVSGSTSIIVLGEYGTGNATDTGTGTTTTINTSKYDTESGAFTNEGVTVTISQIIYGKGDLVVEGNGKLVLTAANEYTSSTTIKEGATVVSQNASALGTGDVKVSGGTLQVDVTTTTGAITFSDTGKLLVSQTLLATAGELEDGETASVAIISSSTITFGDVSLSEGDVTEDVAGWAAAQAGQYIITGWTYDGGTLYAIVAIPEPSMFGLMFGLGALGLVATRRRRRAA